MGVGLMSNMFVTVLTKRVYILSVFLSVDIYLMRLKLYYWGFCVVVLLHVRRKCWNEYFVDRYILTQCI